MKVVDMHCDTIAEIYKDHKKGGRQSILENQMMLDLKKMQAGDYGLQNFALYVNLEQAKGRPFEFCMELLDTFYQEMEAHEDIIGIVRSYEDISRNWEQGRMSALLTVEEGGTCQGKTAFLRDFYRLGVRMMTLTWNFPNELAFPNARMTEEDGTFRMAPDTEHGLTDTGIAFVEEMERLGMIIDISHLNDAGIWDDMIRALAERGGVMGINYCTAFLRDFGPGEEQLSRISDMVEHMKHIRKIGGIGCIGLGSDFDGISGNLEMGDAGKLPMLAHAMEREGFTPLEIEAVFCKNVLRVYKEVL